MYLKLCFICIFTGSARHQLRREQAAQDASDQVVTLTFAVLIYLLFGTSSVVLKRFRIQFCGLTLFCNFSAGNVYHVYTQRLYSLFDDFEMSEVKRQPMTEVALRLKSMLRGNDQSENREETNGGNPAAESSGDGLSAGVEEKAKQEEVSESAQSTDICVSRSETERNEETSIASPITSPVTTNKPSTVATPPPLLPSVTSVLLSLIEPPSLHSIHAALHTLHSYGMLTSSVEHSKLTEIGTLAADLPVDFMLGRFIGYAGMHFYLSFYLRGLYCRIVFTNCAYYLC